MIDSGPAEMPATPVKSTPWVYPYCAPRDTIMALTVWKMM